MASILSKLPRAAFATRASRSAVRGIAGAARPADAIRVSSAAAGGPKSSEEEEEEKARPKSEVACAANPSQTRDFPLSVEGRPAAPILVSPAAEGPNSEKEYRNPPVDDSVLESKESMWAFYEYWCKFHGISRDRREMTRRFKKFSDNARMVHEFNNSGSKGSLAMNHLADLTNAELKARLGKRRYF